MVCNLGILIPRDLQHCFYSDDLSFAFMIQRLTFGPLQFFLPPVLQCSEPWIGPALLLIIFSSFSAAKFIGSKRLRLSSFFPPDLVCI